jgi:hypothetical protein
LELVETVCELFNLFLGSGIPCLQFGEGLLQSGLAFGAHNGGRLLFKNLRFKIDSEGRFLAEEKRGVSGVGRGLWRYFGNFLEMRQIGPLGDPFLMQVDLVKLAGGPKLILFKDYIRPLT